MARIRNVKPSFFRHEELQELEIKYPGKYPMFVFEGLWTLCDRQGVFEWKPRCLKLDILPFLPFEMAETLIILEESGYVRKYEVDGKVYGIIPTFSKHQSISLAEQKSQSVFPLPQNQTEIVETTAETAKTAEIVCDPDEIDEAPQETVLEPDKNGFKTVSEPFQNTGNLNSEFGNLNSEFGNSDTRAILSETSTSPPEKSVCEILDPQKLFLKIWQTTPENVFNSLARIESPKEWARFWSTSPPSCDEVRRVLQNVIDDVNSGALERRYIPKTPDRFVLGGGFTRHQTHFKNATKKTSPPSNLAGKKSLGGLT